MQEGGSESEVFAVAFAASLVLGQCPILWNYTQKSIRQHPMDSLESITGTTQLQPRAINKKYHSVALHSSRQTFLQ